MPCLDNAAREGHVLHNTLFDHFIPIQQWADKPARNSSGTFKPTAPLSQNLSVVAANAKSEHSHFCRREHVIPVLDQAREAFAGRSHLVHSKITTAHTNDASNSADVSKHRPRRSGC
jgi:hypothetical protein